MNKYTFHILFIAAAVLMLAGCKKDENRVVFKGGTAPALTASATGPIVLQKDNSTNTAVTFSWTNPDYMFNTGVSSQNVSYILQIDTAGKNFTSPKLQEQSVVGDVSIALTVKELNTILNKMALDAGVTHSLDIRVKSTLGSVAAPLYSNTVSVRVNPYLDVAVPLPASGKLYITGGATPAGWQAGAGESAPEGQIFSQVNATTFELKVTLKANESYLLLPVYGSWAAKYGYTGANNQNNVNGDTFKPDGGDIKAPGETASYKITVDFRTGRFTVVKQ